LSEWHRKTKKLKIIADSQRQIGGIELPEMSWGNPRMSVNSTNGFLNLTFVLARKRPLGESGVDITGEAIYTYDPSVEKWRPVAPNAYKPDQKGARYLVPKDYNKTYDIQNYKNGAIAVTGYGQHWKLVFFYRAGDETVARWAQSQPLQAADAAASSEDTADALITAACAGDISRLQQMISQGASINTHDENGYTLLICAIDYKQSEAALWLIRQGADITMTGRDGGNPLTYAAWRDQTNVVIELLNHKANPNTHFNNGQTPLMLASANGNLDMVKQLIEKGARTTSMDNKKRTALTWAVYAPNPDVLNYFLQRAPDASALNAALYRAIQWGCNQTNNIAILLKHGADIHTDLEISSYMVLDKAAMYSEPETVQFLIDNGAKVNYRKTVTVNNNVDEIGYPTLMNAARENRADNIRVLLRAGADLFKTVSFSTNNDTCSSVFSILSQSDGNSRAEARAVLLEALGQYLLRTGDDRP